MSLPIRGATGHCGSVGPVTVGADWAPTAGNAAWAAGGEGARVGTAEERFRVLYDRSYSKVLGYALRRADSRDDAFDVVAETFLVAWRRLDDVPEGERALLWLYGADS